MTGRRGFILLAIPICAVLSGCSHFREDQAIAAFTNALVSGDLDKLRAVTSSDFENKALRRSEALDDLQVLNLPEEPPAIVEVKHVGDSEKQVTVTKADGESQLLYKLTFDKSSSRWVVDDIFTKQQKAGVSVSKAITEQMDLLLTIREFLEVWEEDDRQAVLAITAPEFRSVLSDLPAPWLARVTKQVVGNSEPNKSRRKHKPQVAIDGSEAVVRLPRTDGTLQLSMEMDQAGWKVSDAAILTRRTESAIGSIRNHASVIVAGTQFVEAFRHEKVAKLQMLSTAGFFESALKDADIKSATVPDIILAPEDYELRATVDHATMVVPTPGSVVQLDLQRVELDPSDPSDAKYLVKEVSLYEADGKNQIRLSSFFTATQRARKFHEALASGNLKMLRATSSRTFAERVWSKASGLPVQLLPMGPAADRLSKTGAPQISGSVTHVPAEHASGPVIYVLRDSDGRLVVDDVLIGTKDKNRSLRKSLELSIPILAFASGIETGQLSDLQRVSSDDFNRRVWDRTRTIPDTSLPVASLLTKPVRAMRTRGGRAMIELGTPQSGATVSLITERENWVIDDIELANGLDPSKHVQLKQSLRSAVLAQREGAELRNRVASKAPNPAMRKRFDLSRKDVAVPIQPRRSLALAEEQTAKQLAATQPQTPITPVGPDAFGPADKPAAKPDSTVVQVGRTINDKNDPGVTHAMMFEPVEKSKSPAMPEPGIVMPAKDAKPMQPTQPNSVSDDNVDLDALFADTQPAPQSDNSTNATKFEDAGNSAMPTTPQKLIPTPSQTDKPQAAQETISSLVPTNDPGRVTDPALQPIRIPE